MTVSTALLQDVKTALLARGWTVAVAESCTAGLLGYTLTRLPGSSAYFVGGVIAYSNQVKQNLLAVPEQVLMAHGAVSEPVVRVMAESVRQRLGAQVGIAISGIAGPGGGTPEKPVGTTWIAVQTPDGGVARKYRFTGDRDANRHAAVEAALQLLLAQLAAT